MKLKISRNIKDIESFMAELDELGNDMKAAVKEMPIEDIRNGGRPWRLRIHHGCKYSFRS